MNYLIRTADFAFQLDPCILYCDAKREITEALGSNLQPSGPYSDTIPLDHMLALENRRFIEHLNCVQRRWFSGKGVRLETCKSEFVVGSNPTW